MRHLLLGFLVVLCSGCVTAEGSFKEKGIERAAFELGCPKDQLQTTVLHRNDGLGCAGSQVGVTGCGKKATYVCTETQDWLKNSETAAADSK